MPSKFTFFSPDASATSQVLAMSTRLRPIDIARGLCMLLVVAMHATLGVEAAFGQVSAFHGAIEFAKSFRIPAFYLISGLFFARAMTMSWPELFRRRLLALGSIYLFWLALHLGLRHGARLWQAPFTGVFGPDGLLFAYLEGLLQPFGTLWFLYLLIVFIVAARLLRGVPIGIVLVLAALTETARIQTGLIIIDEFAGRFVYFVLGIALSGWLRRQIGRMANTNPPGLWMRPLGLALLAWLAAALLLFAFGLDRLTGFSLLCGAAGAFALLACGILLDGAPKLAPLAELLALIGRRSLVIYLVFTIPMAAIRSLLLIVSPMLPVSLVAVLVTLGAVMVALLVERLARSGWLARFFDGKARFRPAKA